MSMAEAFLAEFEQEAAITRKYLERVPEGQLTWKPHEKSMTAGQLALHIAGTPGQVATMVQADELPPPDFSAENPQPKSVAEVLEALDQSVTTVRELLPGMDDTRMNQAWRIVADGNEIMSMPRAAAIRMIMLSHFIQHRGQLAVYLRLLGQKVPSSYGPSADELPDFMQNAKSA